MHNFVFFGICFFGGFVLGGLIVYGILLDIFDEHFDECRQDMKKLIAENRRLKAVLSKFVPDNSIWGFTKGDKV